MSNDNNKRKASRKSHVTRLLYVKVSLSRSLSLGKFNLFILIVEKRGKKRSLDVPLTSSRPEMIGKCTSRDDGCADILSRLIVPRVNLIATQSLTALRAFNRHRHVNNKLQPAWSSRHQRREHFVHRWKLFVALNSRRLQTVRHLVDSFSFFSLIFL